MDKQTFFWSLVALFVAVLIIGPFKHLWTGVVVYKKVYNPHGRKIIRQDGPEKFYAYVLLEFVALFFLLGFVILGVVPNSGALIDGVES